MSATLHDLATKHTSQKDALQTRKNLLFSFCEHWKEYSQTELCKVANADTKHIENQIHMENSQLREIYGKMANKLEQEENIMQMRHRIEELEMTQSIETMTDT
jgi:Ni,Fe-hydrogenase I large subunit